MKVLQNILLLSLWLYSPSYANQIEEKNALEGLYTNYLQRLTVSEVITGIDRLEGTLKDYFIQYAVALTQEVNYKERGKILKYLPSIGYNFITQTPHLYFNADSIYSAINDKQIKEARIKGIKRELESAYLQELEKLHKNYGELQAQIEYFNHALEVYQINLAIFQIKQAEYEQLEIGPLEFLNCQIKIKGQLISLREKYINIFKLKELIINIAKAGPKAELFK